MTNKYPIGFGIAAMLCLAVERVIAYRFYDTWMVNLCGWMQYAFFLFFIVELVCATMLHLKNPDQHLDGGTRIVLFLSILVCAYAVFLYNVPLRLLDLLARLFAPALPVGETGG